MQTSLAPFIRDTLQGKEAERILRACVHCGFCNATCPTYQLLGDELDGPRGRIYLIKQLLEGQVTSARTLTHLDRCLTCRACETTCPSGVEYAKLAEIGRRVAEEMVGRHWVDRLFRTVLRKVFPHPSRARFVFTAARTVGGLLPRKLREQIPPAPAPATKPLPAIRKGGPSDRFVVLLGGCVQQAAAPNTNLATLRVLEHVGVRAIVPAAAGCCGAVSYHLSAHEEGLDFMRRNIDAWWPHVEHGAEAIVSNASGCGAVINDYGYLLRDDPSYAERAARVSALARDLCQVLTVEDIRALPLTPPSPDPVAFHCPCSLQHGLKLAGSVERLLAAAGVVLTSFRDGHLCCGSAGTYSLLQPALAEQLLERKLDAIENGTPPGAREIVTANIGCQLHLSRRAEVPVRHWIELIEARLRDPA